MEPLMKDDWPQITPTWVDLENGKLSQILSSRDDRIAISVTDQNNPYQMVTVRGGVVEQTTGGADKLAKKFLGVDTSTST